MRATSLHIRLLVLHLVQQLDTGIIPDFGERTLEHVAEGMIAPELVGMNLAVPRNTADAAPGAVPLIELKQLEHFLGAFRVFLLHAHPDVGAIGMVVHGKHFRGPPFLKQSTTARVSA